MHIHCVFRKPCRLGDFSDIQILYKPEEENGTLFFGKSLRRFPNLLNLFVNHSTVFRRNTAIRPIVNVVAVDPTCLPPELKATAPHMIANQIDSNPHQPGMDAAVAAKRATALVS